MQIDIYIYRLFLCQCVPKMQKSNTTTNIKKIRIWQISKAFDKKYLKSTARNLCLVIVNGNNAIFSMILKKLRGIAINNDNIIFMR